MEDAVKVEKLYIDGTTFHWYQFPVKKNVSNSPYSLTGNYSQIYQLSIDEVIHQVIQMIIL